MIHVLSKFKFDEEVVVIINKFVLFLVISILSANSNASDPIVIGNVTQSLNNPLEGIAEVEVVSSGFRSTEGPVWHAQSNSMLFTDIPGNTIYSLNTSSLELTVLRSPSNNANGLALDNDGHLLAAEQATSSISRMNLVTGVVSEFITAFEQDQKLLAFNSPNDIAVHSSGTVFFTDPPYGLRGRESELGFNGVYARKSDGKIELIKSFVDENPNGIVFNHDETTLYLAVSHDESGPVLAFDVSSDGALSNEREFVSAQNTDGMTVDTHGNLYVATRTGIRVWSSQGKEWGWIKLPNEIRTTNVAIGGAEMNTLFITNRSEDLYSVELNISR